MAPRKPRVPKPLSVTQRIGKAWRTSARDKGLRASWEGVKSAHREIGLYAGLGAAVGGALGSVGGPVGALKGAAIGGGLAALGHAPASISSLAGHGIEKLKATYRRYNALKARGENTQELRDLQKVLIEARWIKPLRQIVEMPVMLDPEAWPKKAFHLKGALVPHAGDLPLTQTASGHRIYKSAFGNDSFAFYAHNTKTNQRDMEVSGKMRPGRVFHIDGLAGRENSTIKAHEFYHHLLHAGHVSALKSSDTMSQGGSKVWKKFTGMPGVHVTDEHGHKLRPQWGLNFGQFKSFVASKA